MLLQQSLELCAALASGGWAEAYRERNPVTRATIAESWAWVSQYCGFPDATAEAHGVTESAAGILARRRTMQPDLLALAT